LALHSSAPRGASPAWFTPIRLPENRGKRVRARRGLARARGEIVVTVDSDSMIERQTLLAVAGPFRDPRVGAVAGKVAVHNRRANLIPRMLHVRFILSFDFLRSAQSVFRTVYLLPGALAAYRASVVRQVLSEWERQNLPRHAVHLRRGPRAHQPDPARGLRHVYQRTAVVHNRRARNLRQAVQDVPCAGDRSYIREEFRFARIV